MKVRGLTSRMIAVVGWQALARRLSKSSARAHRGRQRSRCHPTRKGPLEGGFDASKLAPARPLSSTLPHFGLRRLSALRRHSRLALTVGVQKTWLLVSAFETSPTRDLPS